MGKRCDKTSKRRQHTDSHKYIFFILPNVSSLAVTPVLAFSTLLFGFCLFNKNTKRRVEKENVVNKKRETAEKRLKGEKRVKYHPKCVKPCRDYPRHPRTVCF